MKNEISILGCGWLGLPLAVSLIRAGFIVKASVRSLNNIEKIKSLGINPFIIDLNKLDNSISEFLLSEILIICIPPQNIENFKNLISHIEISPVKKVLLVSSTSVYNNMNCIVTDENPLNNSLPSQIENIFKSNNKFQTNIVRFGGLFGYERKPGNFFPEGAVINDPESYVNLIHQDDCVEIINLLIKKDIWNETFNACADSHPTRRNFYTKEAEKVGKRTPVFNENSINEYKIISSEKIKTFLDFKFKYDNLMTY